jgi:hypothetical protein
LFLDLHRREAEKATCLPQLVKRVRILIVPDLRLINSWVCAYVHRGVVSKINNHPHDRSRLSFIQVFEMRDVKEHVDCPPASLSFYSSIEKSSQRSSTEWLMIVSNLSQAAVSPIVLGGLVNSEPLFKIRHRFNQGVSHEV